MPIRCDEARCVTFAYAIAVLSLLIVSLMGCDELNNSAATRDNGEPDQPAQTQLPTIVSLTPAVTQMLIDMGKREQIIGVSKEDNPTLGLPSCGSFNDPIMAKILDLQPAVVITESPFGKADDAPPMLRSLAEQGIYKLAVIPHSRSITDVQRALTDPQTGLGNIVGDQPAAERALRLMQIRLDLIRASVEGARQPRVLMLIEPATLGALGPGATHDEMLRLAGGINAVAEFKTDYLKLTRSQVQVTVRPDVVLIIEPGGRAIVDNDPRLRSLEGLDVDAITRKRCVVINHAQAMLPSTSLPEVIKQMAKAIHPDRAEAIDKAYALAEQLLDRTDQGESNPQEIQDQSSAMTTRATTAVLTSGVMLPSDGRGGGGL